MQETASAHTHKRPQTWVLDQFRWGTQESQMGINCKMNHWGSKQDMGLPLTLGKNSKTIHTLSKMPNGTILNQVHALSFPNVCFYSIINHILQATCKLFCSCTVSFQVLVMMDMLALD